jgi:hypothetical protein
LCPFCYKKLSKNDSKKGLALNEDQENIFDQTAAESEVDQADKDTRCQSSLLTSQRNQIASSSMINEDNQINTF